MTASIPVPSPLACKIFAVLRFHFCPLAPPSQPCFCLSVCFIFLFFFFFYLRHKVPWVQRDSLSNSTVPPGFPEQVFVQCSQATYMGDLNEKELSPPGKRHAQKSGRPHALISAKRGNVWWVQGRLFTLAPLTLGVPDILSVFPFPLHTDGSHCSPESGRCTSHSCHAPGHAQWGPDLVQHIVH